MSLRYNFLFYSEVTKFEDTEAVSTVTTHIPDAKEEERYYSKVMYTTVK